MLTGGQVADCTAGAELLARLPPCEILHARQGLRQQRDPPAGRGERRDAEHPAQSQSQVEELLLAVPLSNRNAIERMFCRLKDFRRVATRYDRNAANFLAAVCIAATVSYWL